MTTTLKTSMLALGSRGWAAFIKGRDRIGHRVECALICISVLAIVFAAVNGVLTDHSFRVLDISWTAWMWMFHSFAWATFVFVFLLYGLTSHRTFPNYCRKWWPNLMVCIFWVPSSSLWVDHLPAFLSLDMLLLVGTFAHVIRVADFARRELRKLRGWAPLKARRDAVGQHVEAFTILLSIASIAVIGIAQMVPDQNSLIPVLGMTWATMQETFRLFTWAVFLIVFCFFGLTSDRPALQYCRMWWLELVICVVWEPIPSPILQTIAALLPPGLVLTGSVAHLLRVCGWARRRLYKHPHWAIIFVVVSVYSSITLLLMTVEPKTFGGSFWASFVSVYMAALTTGGALHPTTFVGWCIFAVNGTAGVVIIGVIAREWGNRGMFAQLDEMKRVLQAVIAGQELQRQALDKHDQVLRVVQDGQALSGDILARLVDADEKLRASHEKHDRALSHLGTMLEQVQDIAAEGETHHKRTVQLDRKVTAALSAIAPASFPTQERASTGAAENADGVTVPATADGSEPK